MKAKTESKKLMKVRGNAEAVERMAKAIRECWGKEMRVEVLG